MARMVRQLLRTGVPGHHIAILYPKHSVADRIEEALVGVPYLRYGRTKLMKRRAPSTPALSHRSTRWLLGCVTSKAA